MSHDVTDVQEIEPHAAHELLASGTPIVDVREPHEHVRGWIPGSRRRAAGDDPLVLCMRERADAPAEPGIIVCASGVRSVTAARALADRGHAGWRSLAGGIDAWAAAGLPLEHDDALTAEQRERYSRQLLLPDVGIAGQRRLLQSRVLVIGAGGLGSPVILYLAAAGVGTIGIADDDCVDPSNLHRQIVHDTDAIGMPKAESAARRARALNPDVDAVALMQRVDVGTIDGVLAHGWDAIVDCSDSFETRYLVSDAAARQRRPIIHGSIYRTDGQVAVLSPPDGPCYRCLFPEPVAAELAPNCATAGVLGVLPGIIGSMQAAETLKLLLGIDSRLRGGLLLYDALQPSMEIVRMPRRPGCQGCGTVTG